jgi:hypothetical protein
MKIHLDRRHKSNINSDYLSQKHTIACVFNVTKSTALAAINIL